MHARADIVLDFPWALSLWGPVPVLAHPRDRLPLVVLLSITALDFVLYLLVEHWAILLGYWLVMMFPKAMIGAWNHHHQHVATFRNAGLNRALEMCYALHTGLTTHAWLLHHNFGHHINYLDQSRDESGWKRSDGSTMGVLEYTFTIALTAYPRAFRVGAKYPSQRRTFVIFGLLTLALVAALVGFRALPGLFLFVLPMLSTLLLTCWVTYDHHAGLDADSAKHASYNIMNLWFNRLTGNLGYHTAHHMRPGLHWSELPEFHQRIKHTIPRELYISTTFDMFFPAASPDARDLRSLDEREFRNRRRRCAAQASDVDSELIDIDAPEPAAPLAG